MQCIKVKYHMLCCHPATIIAKDNVQWNFFLFVYIEYFDEILLTVLIFENSLWKGMMEILK